MSEPKTSYGAAGRGVRTLPTIATDELVFGRAEIPSSQPADQGWTFALTTLLGVVRNMEQAIRNDIDALDGRMQLFEARLESYDTRLRTRLDTIEDRLDDLLHIAGVKAVR